MIKKQIENYIMRNSNIDFNYNGKRYGIERMKDDDSMSKIYFWEWHNEATFDTAYSNFSDFENNAKIDGVSVVEILRNIDDVDVF